MRHRLAVLSAVLTLAATAAGCSHDKGGKASWEPGAPGSPAPAAAGDAPTPESVPTGVAVASGTPAGDELDATGFGPYAIGTAQAKLASSGLVGKVSKDVNGCGAATGTKKWNSPGLIFTDGKLEHLKVTTPKIKTTEGVKVGTAYAALKGKYPSGKELADWVGATGWYARSGDFALLFRIKNEKVSAIEAGSASTLQFTFTDNQGC
jgi:hypothetical protein